jgi:hypothetical protein
MNYQAWVAAAAGAAFQKQSLDRPPLGTEEVEVANEARLRKISDMPTCAA